MADKKPTFEQMLKKLEGITARLESGELPLEKSLDAFEEGMKLARELDKPLSQAEAKVELLLKKENGQVQTSWFVYLSPSLASERVIKWNRLSVVGSPAPFILDNGDEINLMPLGPPLISGGLALTGDRPGFTNLRNRPGGKAVVTYHEGTEDQDPWWAPLRRWYFGFLLFAHFPLVLLPRLHDLAVEPHVLQHRPAVFLGGVLDDVVEQAPGLGEVLGLAGGPPERVAGLGAVAARAGVPEGSLRNCQ